MNKPWIAAGITWQEWARSMAFYCDEKKSPSNPHGGQPIYGAYLELCLKTDMEPR